MKPRIMHDEGKFYTVCVCVSVELRNVFKRIERSKSFGAVALMQPSAVAKEQALA